VTLLLTLSFVIGLAQQKDLSLMTVSLHKAPEVRGLLIVRLPKDSSLVLFIAPRSFRSIPIQQIRTISIEHVDSSTFRDLRPNLETSLADLQLLGGNVFKGIYPISLDHDSILVFAYNTAIDSLSYSRIQSITIPRTRCPKNFRNLGFFVGMGIGGPAGFFFGNAQIPFGSQERTAKSFNQFNFGNMYNAFLGVVIGGSLGYVTGFSLDAISSKRVTLEIDDLTSEDRVQLLREIVGAYER